MSFGVGFTGVLAVIGLDVSVSVTIDVSNGRIGIGGGVHYVTGPAIGFSAGPQVGYSPGELTTGGGEETIGGVIIGAGVGGSASVTGPKGGLWPITSIGGGARFGPTIGGGPYLGRGWGGSIDLTTPGPGIRPRDVLM